jgi:hypothetical protein
MISGSYTVEITMGRAFTQPQNVQAVIGKHGENLRGPWIVTLDKNGKYIPVKFPRSAEPSSLEPFIHFTQRVEVAGDPSSDIAAKTRAIADRREWSVKSCTSGVDVTNAMVGSGASTGHLILGAERQATIDNCIADNESHLQKAIRESHTEGQPTATERTTEPEKNAAFGKSDAESDFDHDYRILKNSGEKLVEAGALKYGIFGWHPSLDLTLRDLSTESASSIIKGVCDRVTELRGQWNFRVYLVDGKLAGECNLKRRVDVGLKAFQE